MSNDGQRRVFILGAGASRFAGYPLAAELLDFLQKHAPKLNAEENPIYYLVKAKRQLEDEASLRDSSRREGINLETLITRLDLEGQVTGLRMSTRLDWKTEGRKRAISMIGQVFDTHQFSVIHATRPVPGPNAKPPANIDIELVQRVSERWGKFLCPGDSLITFNWDVLHESMLYRAGKWLPLGGYGPILFDTEAHASSSPIQIFKLHGSINWFVESPSDATVRLCRPRLISDQIKTTPWFAADPPDLDNPPLVLPTYLKDVSAIRPLVTVWACAQEVLQTATEIWVIGYSLSLNDHLARLLISTQLSKNSALNTVHLVSDHPGHWPEFCSIIGKELDHIPKRFEEWILE